MTRGALKAAIALAILLGSAAAADKAEKVEFECAGKTRVYSYFRPSAGSVSPLPLLILLHGTGRSGSDMIGSWIQLAARENFVIAAPNASDGMNWNAAKDGTEFLHAVVEDVSAKTPVDAKRIYLFGHSAGGGFALIMAMLESEYFAAVGAHAGVLRPQHASVLEFGTRKIPIMMWNGDADRAVPIEAVRKTKEMLTQKGFPVELQVMEGHTHDYYAVAKDLNVEIWQALKKVENPKPTYQPYTDPAQ